MFTTSTFATQSLNLFNIAKCASKCRNYFYLINKIYGLHTRTYFHSFISNNNSSRMMAHVNLDKSTFNRVPTMDDLKFLTQAEAISIDQELFSDYHFTLDQLMELAGLSCAVAISKTYPLSSITSKNRGSVLVCCGPGNNGGDGLVCARHLKFFGYRPSVFYPRQGSNPFFEALNIQCRENQIPLVPYLPGEASPIRESYDIIVDAIFGFSFKPPLRSPFDEVLMKLRKIDLPIVSIDIPSGWDVEEGNIDGNGLEPEMLISLTAPKLCAKNFRGKYHWLGGRFVPSSLAEKYQLNLPPYLGYDPCVIISVDESCKIPSQKENSASNDSGDQVRPQSNSFSKILSPRKSTPSNAKDSTTTSCNISPTKK